MPGCIVPEPVIPKSVSPESSAVALEVERWLVQKLKAAENDFLVLHDLQSGNLLEQYPAAHTLPTEPVARDYSLLGSQRWKTVCLLPTKIDALTLTRLIARIRTLHTDHVLHISDHCNGWTIANSLALGFTQQRTADDAGYYLYEYDLRHYKPAPDWLNSKNWANPEQWGKHRW